MTRWRYPEINLPGMTALGLGLGTQMQERGIRPEIAVGNDTATIRWPSNARWSSG